MAKKIFEDMVRVKREKKSFTPTPQPKKEKIQTRNVDEKKDSTPEKKILEEEAHQASKQEEQKLIYDTVYRDKEELTPSGSRPNNLIWFFAVCTVIFFLFALSFFFSKAKITIVPLEKEVVLNKDFYATLNNTNALPFHLVVMEGEDETFVTGGEKTDAKISATGKVLIYNDYNSTSQTLDIDTRLEGSNGKIYKTAKKVLVPGRSADGTPGSVEAEIYASEAGAEYNSKPLDFTIVGFKGGPKYDAFYARSVGGISGGLSGFVAVVSPEQKAEALGSLKEKLKARLLSKIEEQIPPGFILFKDAVFLEITNEEVNISAEGDSVPVRVSGTLYGFLFKETDLSPIVAESTLVEYDQSEVYIPDLGNFNFTLLAKPESFKDVKSINFNLSGRQKIVWRVDGELVAKEMFGRKRKDFSQVLLNHPNILSADLVLRPVWRKTVPEDLKRIKVIINYPK